jgi:hypothetical protein
MYKVLSATKSLQRASSLQVNVEEGTEVGQSGHGSAYVKNEKIETDASNAEDPIQDTNISVLFLKERERVARPVMRSQHLKRDRK